MYVFFYICEFGRAGKGGGAPDRVGTLGNSPAFGAPFGAGFCRRGSGGGVAMAFGTGGCGRPGGDGAVRVATRLGLAEFDLFGFTSKS